MDKKKKRGIGFVTNQFLKMLRIIKEKPANKYLKSPSGRGVGVGNKQFHLYAGFS